MENHSLETIENIKQEPETNFSLIFSQHLKLEVIDSIPFEQLTLKQIVDSVSSEPEVDFTLTLLQYLKSDGDDSISLDQFTSNQIIDNIKHEPEVHFTLTLPEDPEQEIEEVKEVKILLRKFDRKWKTEPEVFKSYYVCFKCDYVTSDFSHLNRHLKVCKNHQKCKNCFLMGKSENFEECGMCDLKFDCTICKTSHQTQDHLKGSNWHCIKCDFKTSYRYKFDLIRHYLTHLKKFLCETCKKGFSEKRQLKGHQQQHRHGVFASKSQIKFECEQCVHSFATKDGLRKHKNTVHCENKFQCDVCGKTSKTKSVINLHLQTHQKVFCPICQYMIAEYRLKEHVEQHSSTEKFKCYECKKVYLNKKALKDHKRMNHEIDEVQCDLCSKMFKNKFLLRGHMNNHLKVQCQFCTKLISKSSITDHIKVVHPLGQRFVRCDIARCKQKFKNVKELKVHKKIHIGELLYKCPKCDYHSNAFFRMKKHIKRFEHEI